MENSKGPSSIRNTTYNGKNSFLPPKIPLPSISSSYLEYVPSSVLGQKGIPKPIEGNSHHLRTSSESFLVEEQPSWFDELLTEPETPVRKGAHRRSSSDSFAYIDTSNVVNFDFQFKDENNSRNMMPPTSWGLPDFDYYKDARHASIYTDPNPSWKHKNRAWDASLNSAVHPRGLPSTREKIMIQSTGSSSSPQEVGVVSSAAMEKQDSLDAGPHEPKGLSERKESSHAKSSASETDTKRAKQQFAQRSRVRKLQYIAELERNVQALQAEGSDISAELEFLNQQNLILSMENKALSQRLESLAQEQLIKHLEHEVLEREIGRLRALYQQQQPSSGLRRTSSRDLDEQLVNLSLKHKEANAGRDLVTAQQQSSSGIRRTSSRDLDQQLAMLSLVHKDSNAGRDLVSGQQQSSSGLRRTSSRDLDQQVAAMLSLQHKEANAGRDSFPGQQQSSSGLRRTSSRDLNQQLVATLSLQHKEATAGRDSFPGQLHI